VATAYLSMGSNLGDRLAFLRSGVKGLVAAPGVRVVKLSSIYETTPVGVTGQPDYLNLVAAIETGLTPHELLSTCLAIEKENGRERSVRWGARTLDLDILLYDDVQMETDDLVIPHPRMKERAFVLVPLLEIEPEIVVLGQPASVWLKQIPDKGQEVRYFASTHEWIA
jgi:2-amino-4-hydroxy-6-hydroxymethyldihydropteridine pyrophosphokinase